MNKNATSAILIAVGIFAASFLLDFFMAIPGILTMIVGGIAGAIVGMMVYRKNGEINVNVRVEANARVGTVPTAAPVDSRTRAVERRIPEVREALGKLINLNTQIRMAGLDLRILEAVERIIDKTIDTIVPLNQKFPSDNLTAIFNRTANQYLPQLVKEYIDLNTTNREQTVEAFLGRLANLEEVIDRANAAVNDAERTEFNIEVAFIRERLNMES